MPRNGTNWGSRTFLREMTPPRSTAPAYRRPQFNHQDTEPVPLRGTLDRVLLRPEQTGWAVLYAAWDSSCSFSCTCGVGGCTLTPAFNSARMSGLVHLKS